ncbi:hypothetical protein [Hymenobacter sp. 102]|uniref:hypothetical protein n=1 Tax=Hymenobacter sp. 102 TaxID=3403152 RepID=UPI003CF5D8E5
MHESQQIVAVVIRRSVSHQHYQRRRSNGVLLTELTGQVHNAQRNTVPEELGQVKGDGPPVGRVNQYLTPGGLGLVIKEVEWFGLLNTGDAKQAFQ